MGFLREFEHKLENVVEGFFARVLPGGGIQPIEIGKAMVRAMREDQTRSASGLIFVPNRFSFRLSPKDHERLTQIGSQLRKELVAVAKRAAAAEQWQHAGPVEVEVILDPSVKRGNVEIDATYREGKEPPRPMGTHTQLIEMSLAADAEIVLLGKAPQTWPVSKQTIVIGRSDECDVVLVDPGASRRHAEVRREGDEWVILDLGSTNGTELNGRRVNRHRLSPGDRILIGGATLEFRRP
jgi:hypothetical protein